MSMGLNVKTKYIKDVFIKAWPVPRNRITTSLRYKYSIVDSILESVTSIVKNIDDTQSL